MDNETRYRMDGTYRGKAIIINNKQFQHIAPRNFSDIDVAKLYMALCSLEFKVEKYNDLTAQQIDICLNKASKEDHKEFDCFLCVILSHGDYGVIEGTDQPVQIDNALDYFKGHNCPSLAGKPKIFIFQACNALVYKLISEQADSSSGQKYKIPSEADFLMVWSLVPGEVPWRPRGKPSCFIDALVKRLDTLGKEKEINYILTRVLRDVCNELETKAPVNFEKCHKQLPCVINMLTKELYFTPKQK